MICRPHIGPSFGPNSSNKTLKKMYTRFRGHLAITYLKDSSTIPLEKIFNLRPFSHSYWATFFHLFS